MQNKRRKKKRTSQIGLVAGIVVLMVVLAAVFLFQPDNIVDELTVEAGAPAPEASQFLVENKGESAKFVTDLSTIDFSVPGDYPVELSYKDEVYESKILVRDTVAPVGAAQNLSAYSNEDPKAEDFVTSVEDVTQVTISYKKAPDLTKEGSRMVTILLTDQGGNITELEAVLTVFIDTVGPELSGVAPLYTYLGTEPDYFAAVTAKDAYDLAPVILVDDSKVDLNTTGTYDVTFKAVDEAGNETTAATTLTVTDDNVAPEIQGVHEIAVYVGSTVSYRSGIRVIDDKDANPKLSIDSSGVDLSTPGTYTLVYSASDITGNVSQRETTVTVELKPDTYVDEAVIYAAADEILAKITTDDMTQEAKVRAVYSWIRSNFTYAGGTVKTDWLQGAYILMTEGRGDCFNFFGLSKLMLERLGVDNIDVRKVKNHEGDSNHYWSMVSLDGGETWYHYDATPYPWDPHDFCLVTDAFIDEFSANHKGYFNRDTSLYPATPTE